MSEQVQTNGLEDQAPSINDFQVTVNGEAFTLGQLASSPAAAQLLYIAFQQQADAAEVEKREAQQKFDEATARYNEEVGKQHEMGQQARAQVLELEYKLREAESKRDAAAEALKEAQAEIARLNSHNDDLQQQIAVGVRGAINIVNAGDAVEQFKQQLKQEQESKPAIYDVLPLDQKKSRYSAMTLNGDPIEFGYLDLGKYRVLKPEEVDQEIARFRSEQDDQTSAADGQADNHVDSALVEPIAPPPLEGGTFQGDSMEDVHATAGLAQAEPSVEGDGTVEERLAALEKRVTAIENGMLHV